MRRLTDADLLPLTCTRAGTCCHGKDIRITPWELLALAQARGLAAAEFRDRHTDDGGTRLRMSGPPGWRGLPACSQYDPAAGCLAHPGRPLACRLYPLGRERRGDGVAYLHEGRAFPCLDGCPEVASLPPLTVRDYLAGQGAAAGEAVRDAYLEIAQDVAEAAFVLVFDSGLAAADPDWRQDWQDCIATPPAAWSAGMLTGWHDRIILPRLAADPADGPAWAAAHRQDLETTMQASFASLRTSAALRTASRTCLAGAMLLLHAVGTDALKVGRRWLAQALARACQVG